MNADFDSLRELFRTMHQQLGYFGEDEAKPVEHVSFRLGLTAPLPEVPILQESQAHRVEPRQIRLYNARQWHQATLLSRSVMACGQSVEGPALLDDPTSTLFLPPKWLALRDASDNLILTAKE